MSVGLDIALTSCKSALLTRQKEMAVISNNISKANEENYHRQRVSLGSNVVIAGDGGYYGTGVHVSMIAREYDTALETSYRQSYCQSGYTDTYATQLGSIESVLSPEGNDFLNESIQEFATNLQEVASNPESISSRTALIGSANDLADRFNQQYQSLATFRDYIADNTSGSGAISDKVDDLNSLVAQLPDLNDRIRDLETNLFVQAKANDVRDQRDEIISKIAKIANITVTENSDTTYTVTLGGHTLVDGTTGVTDTVNLAMTPGVPHNTPTLTWASDGTAVNLTAGYGEMQALLDSRSYITGKMDELYTFAQEFGDWAAAAPPYSTVNTQHMAGFDLDGNAGGRLFFLTNATQPASGNILSVVITDPRDIAASDAAGEQGNGNNASAIWDGLNATNVTLGNESILSYPNRFLSTIAQDVYAAENMATSISATTTMFKNAVAQRSSVNTDEELTNMLSVQRSYQSAAKMISVIDEMISMVINMA